MASVISQGKLAWLIVMCGLVAACSPPPFVETQRVKSPSSTLDAIIGERQTDATVATPTEVFVVRAGEAVAGEPIFRADHVSGLTAVWKSDRELLVRAEAARVFLYSPKAVFDDGDSQTVAIKLDVSKLECETTGPCQ
jgi:hypothetical protein